MQEGTLENKISDLISQVRRARYREAPESFVLLVAWKDRLWLTFQQYSMYGDFKRLPRAAVVASHIEYTICP